MPQPDQPYADTLARPVTQVTGHKEQLTTLEHRANATDSRIERPASRWLPTGADLDAATAATLATLLDPTVTPQDIQAAAEHEQAVHEAYLQRPDGDAQLQARAEEWAARYQAQAAHPEIELGE
jgi:hypothetical protein